MIFRTGSESEGSLLQRLRYLKRSTSEKGMKRDLASLSFESFGLVPDDPHASSRIIDT